LKRRATHASVSLLASLRSTTGERSLRIDSAVILPSSHQSEGNHEPDPPSGNRTKATRVNSFNRRYQDTLEAVGAGRYSVDGHDVGSGAVNVL